MMRTGVAKGLTVSRVSEDSLPGTPPPQGKASVSSLNVIGSKLDPWVWESTSLRKAWCSGWWFQSHREETQALGYTVQVILFVSGLEEPARLVNQMAKTGWEASPWKSQMFSWFYTLFASSSPLGFLTIIIRVHLHCNKGKPRKVYGFKQGQNLQRNEHVAEASGVRMEEPQREGKPKDY